MGESIRNFVRKYILKNLAFKLVSLAIAVMLWWAVGRDQPIEIPMTVPLEFQHAPSNLEINSDYPFQALVTLRGPERLLQGLRPSEVHAILDLRGANPGERTAQRERGADRAIAISHQLRSQFHAIGGSPAARDWHIVERLWHNRSDGRSGEHYYCGSAETGASDPDRHDRSSGRYGRSGNGNIHHPRLRG
jgi:hypothetical protein